MVSKVVVTITFCLIGILFAKEQLEPAPKQPKGKQGDSNRPEYTDDEIIALIKQELKEREEMHEYNNNEFTSTMAFDFDFSSTLDSYDSKSNDKKKEIKGKNKYDIDEYIENAWNVFGDDIPAILKTMNKLDQAKISLDNDYNIYAKYPEYVTSIKNKIDELLEDYNSIYSQTNELIELISNIYTIEHGNNNKKRVLLNEAYDNELDDVESKAWETFGDDINAIKKTMKQIRDSMNDIKYSDISKEYKLSLKNKMMELLNSYDDVIENTNILVEMIKGFYLMARNN